MSKITLSGDCSWFYLLELWHNKIKGFGITSNEERRLRKGYCYPSASMQTFSRLYYGKKTQIQALERWFKNEYRSELLVLIDKRLEWIDPASYLSNMDDLVKTIESRITTANYGQIYRIRAEHLPFKPSPYFRDIKTDPDKYLERIDS